MATTHAVTEPSIKPTGCCPPFNPAPWQDQEITWHDKPFVKDHVTCLFHVPLNMAGIVMKDMALIDAADGRVGQPLMLSDDQSPWGTDLYIEVKKLIPGAKMEKLSGRFLTKVFEGPFRDAGRWAREMERYVASKGRTLERLYFGYTTCPKCAKAYGKNYVVLFAKVGD